MKKLWRRLFGIRNRQSNIRDANVRICPNCKGTGYISSNNAISLCLLCGGPDVSNNKVSVCEHDWVRTGDPDRQSCRCKKCGEYDV